ncbi:MAG: NADPH-dependent F420 reductase [Pseudomonadota bacterium]
MSDKETIAILGGTGDLGTGLAIRWSKAGYKIVIGSRTLEKAQAAVAALQEISPETPAEAMENLDASAAGDIVVLTVPAEHQISTLDYVKANLQGKILIDVTVPLVPPKVGTVQLPEEGSAGKRAQDFLGEDVMVVTAYQNIAAHLLQQDVAIECDVLVCGNKKDAREKVIQLTKEAGMTGWHAGPVANSAAAEALTSILIQINRSGIVSHSGIKIIGQEH